MLQTPEQFVQAQKATFDLMQSVALKSLEGFEKLTELNLQAVKASMEEGAEQMRSMMAAKELKPMGDWNLAATQPAADRMSAYAKHVYDIASETGGEIAKLFEKQMAEGNKQFSATIDAIAKNAPAGSEGVVTLMKSAVSAASSAYEQANRAAKQAVEAAEANLSVVKTVRPNGRKAA